MEEEDLKVESVDSNDDDYKVTELPDFDSSNFDKMYNLLSKKGYVTVDSDVFKESYSTGENFDSLHSFLTNTEITNLSKSDFQAKYFGIHEERVSREKKNESQEDGGAITGESMSASVPSAGVGSQEENDFGYTGEYSLDFLRSLQDSISELDKQRASKTDELKNYGIAAREKYNETVGEVNFIDSSIAQTNKRIEDIRAVWWLTQKDMDSLNDPNSISQGYFSDGELRDIALEYFRENDMESYEKYTTSNMLADGAWSNAPVFSSLRSIFGDVGTDLEIKKDYELRDFGYSMVTNYISARQETIESKMQDKFGDDYELLNAYNQSIEKYNSISSQINSLQVSDNEKKMMSSLNSMDEELLGYEAKLKDIRNRLEREEAQGGEASQITANEYNSVYSNYEKAFASRNQVYNKLVNSPGYKERKELFEELDASRTSMNENMEKISTDGFSLLEQNALLSESIENLNERNKDLRAHPHFKKMQERKESLEKRYAELTDDEWFNGADEYVGSFVQPAFKLAKGFMEAAYVTEAGFGGMSGYSVFEQLYDLANTSTFVEDLMLPQITQQGLVSDEGFAPSYVWAAKSFNTLGNVALMAGTGVGGRAMNFANMGAKVSSNIAVGTSTYMMSVGDNFKQNLELGMDKKTAAWSAQALSLSSAVTELLVSEVDLFNDVSSGIKNEIVESVLTKVAAGETLTKEVVASIGRDAIKKGLVKVPVQALSEAGEELVAGGAEDLTKWFVNQVTQSTEGIQYYGSDEFNDIYSYAEAGILGYIGGLGPSALGAASESYETHTSLVSKFKSPDNVHPYVASAIVKAAEDPEQLEKMVKAFGDNKDAAKELRNMVSRYNEFAPENSENLTKEDKFDIAIISEQRSILLQRLLNKDKLGLTQSEVDDINNRLKSQEQQIDSIREKANKDAEERRNKAAEEQAAAQTETQEVQAEPESTEGSTDGEPATPEGDKPTENQPSGKPKGEQAQAELDEYKESKKRNKKKDKDGRKVEEAKTKSREKTKTKEKPKQKKKPKKKEKVEPQGKPTEDKTTVTPSDAPLQGTISLSEGVESYGDGDVQLTEYNGEKLETPLSGDLYVDDGGDVIFRSGDTEYVLGNVHEEGSTYTDASGVEKVQDAPHIDINDDVSKHGIELSNQGVGKYNEINKGSDDMSDVKKRRLNRAERREERKKNNTSVVHDSNDVLERTEREGKPREPLPDSESDRIVDNVDRVVSFPMVVDGKRRHVRGTIVKEGDSYFMELMNGSDEKVFLGRESDIQNDTVTEFDGTIENQNVVAFDDGTISVDGKNYKPSTSDPTDSINRNAKGQVTSVDMVNEDGERVRITNEGKPNADAVAYELLLMANDISIDDATEQRLASDPEIVEMLQEGDPNKEATEPTKPTPEQVVEDIESEELVETVEPEVQEDTTEPDEKPDEKPDEAQQTPEDTTAGEGTPQQVDEPTEGEADKGTAQDVREGDITPQETTNTQKKAEAEKPKMSPEERARADKIEREEADRKAKEEKAKKEEAKEKKKAEAKKKKFVAEEGKKKEVTTEEKKKPSGRKKPSVKTERLTAEERAEIKRMKELAGELSKLLRLEGRLPELKVLARKLLTIPVGGIPVRNRDFVNDFATMANMLVQRLKTNNAIGSLLYSQLIDDINHMMKEIPAEFIQQSLQQNLRDLSRMTKSNKASVTYVNMAKEIMAAQKKYDISSSKALSLDLLSLSHKVLEAMRGNASVNPALFDTELSRITGELSKIEQENLESGKAKDKKEPEQKTEETAEEMTPEEVKRFSDDVLRRAEEVISKRDNCK